MPGQQVRRVIPRADHRGYLLDGKLVEGFADRRDLSLRDRIAIARMARRFAPARLSDAQRGLLERAAARAHAPSEALRGFTANAGDDEDAHAAGIYELLTPAQREAVAHPERVTRARYPLTVGQLARIVGATGRQVRHWTDSALLPVHRVRGQRRYFSAAAARAMALARMSNHEIASLAELARRTPAAPRFATLLGTTLASVGREIHAPEVADHLIQAGVLLQRAAPGLRSPARRQG